MQSTSTRISAPEIALRPPVARARLRLAPPSVRPARHRRTPRVPRMRDHRVGSEIVTAQAPSVPRVPVCHVAYARYPADPRVRKEVRTLESAGFAIDVLCVRAPGEVVREVQSGGRVRRLLVGVHRIPNHSRSFSPRLPDPRRPPVPGSRRPVGLGPPRIDA